MSCCNLNTGNNCNQNCNCNKCCNATNWYLFTTVNANTTDQKYSIDDIVTNASNPSAIETYFLTHDGNISLISLMNFYNKILKAEKYGTVQAHVGWEVQTGSGVFHDELVCGDLCSFKQLLEEQGRFYITMTIAIQYYQWNQKKIEYNKRGLNYCCPLRLIVNTSNIS